MKLEPSNLNIRLERRNYFVWKLIAVCIMIAIMFAFIDRLFSIVLFACVIVLSPVWIYSFSSTPILKRTWGDFWHVIHVAIFVGYLALSKSVLIPTVILVIEYIVS